MMSMCGRPAAATFLAYWLFAVSNLAYVMQYGNSISVVLFFLFLFMAFFMMYDAAVTGSDCAHLTQELNKKREANLLTLTDTDIRTLTESDDVKICKLERMLDRQNHGQG